VATALDEEHLAARQKADDAPPHVHGADGIVRLLHARLLVYE